MKKTAPLPLEDLLGKFFRSQGQGQRFQELKVFQLWNEAVGEEIGKNARPVSVNQGRLVVAVRNSIWLSELGFERQKLKKKLNRVLGKGIIQEISFRIGPIPDSVPDPEESPPDSKPLTPELEQKLQKLLSRIDDPDLKSALKNLLRALQ